jgi:hypothetical protein
MANALVFRGTLVAALVLAAGCTEKTWAADWKDDAGLARTEIRALVPPGTPMATAKRLMEAKGCTCKETRNGKWATRAGPFDYLYCTIDDETGFRVVFRSWKVALTESAAGTVADVLVSTGLTGP